jgi:hypothetical protein
MKTFRNLSYALLFLTVISLIMLVPFTQANFNMTVITLLGVFIAVFAISLVAFITSLFMYFQNKTNSVIMLKRRAGRIYSELLHHKTLLITALDGDKPVSTWDHFLYDTDEFPRTKRFLGEEYFLLLSCDSFFCNSKAAQAYNAFKDLHEVLAAFIRSVSYDRAECARFRKLYRIHSGKELTSFTPESEFQNEVFSEAYEALQTANEQALRTVEELLTTIEHLEITMDKLYTDGTDWTTTKKELDARYQVWLNASGV